MTTVGWLGLAALGTGAIVWGADTFAEHLSVAATRLGVSAFALAILLAGAEPEELATAVTASLRKAPAIALGDVIGANIAICLVAIGVGAVIAPLPFDRRVRRYALAGIPAGALAAATHGMGTSVGSRVWCSLVATRSTRGATDRRRHAVTPWR
jgi:cation:H+ antiporter